MIGEVLIKVANKMGLDLVSEEVLKELLRKKGESDLADKWPEGCFAFMLKK